MVGGEGKQDLSMYGLGPDGMGKIQPDNQLETDTDFLPEYSLHQITVKEKKLGPELTALLRKQIALEAKRRSVEARKPADIQREVDFHRNVAKMIRENLSVKASGASRARAWDEGSMRQGITDEEGAVRRLLKEQEDPEGTRQRNLEAINQEIANNNAALKARQTDIEKIMGAE